MRTWDLNPPVSFDELVSSEKSEKRLDRAYRVLFLGKTFRQIADEDKITAGHVYDGMRTTLHRVSKFRRSK